MTQRNDPNNISWCWERSQVELELNFWEFPIWINMEILEEGHTDAALRVPFSTMLYMTQSKTLEMNIWNRYENRR